MHMDHRPIARYRPLFFAGLAAILIAATVLALWPSPSVETGTASRDSSGVNGTLLAAVLAALALMALLGACAGYLAARARLNEPLRDARVKAQVLTQLLDVWHWQTDREHRLTRLQPPHGAASSAWGARPATQFLWERFAGAELKPRMQSQAALADLRVMQTHAGDRRTQWSLRGLPRFDALGQFAGYVGTARALDEDDARRADQQALHTLMSLLPGPVWLLQRESGQLRVRHGNAAAARLAGVEPDQLAGSSWERLIASVPEELRHTLEELTPGHSARRGAWSVHLLHAGDAAPDALLLAVLREAPGASAEDARPSGHESFSYTVSHDLRAPIRVVEGFTRILKEDYGHALDRIGNDHLDRVLGASARMNSMIDALLALAQLSAQPLARQPVNLSQLAGFIVDDLKRQAPERRVQIMVQPGMLAQGDPTLLRVALENLLGNAWKYSGKCTQAEIHFERGAYDGREVFTVRDNGAGFDMRFADRLFGVFQRLHSATDFQGTGIGLASVQRIVRRHGGDIWAESEVGRGAKFHFTLPAATLD
jgi:signal transduction histidine kinase